ncbi:hypothetical protein JCM19992_31950 [Thermostilla marina]
MELRRTGPSSSVPAPVMTIMRSSAWTAVFLAAAATCPVDSLLQAATIPPNNGELWQHDAALHDVVFRGSRGWAVGEHGTIRHTSDGKNWEFQESGVQASLRSVYFLDERTGWAAGGEVLPGSHVSTGIVLKTDDGGRTWTPVARGSTPLILKIGFFDAGRGWAVTAPGPIAPVGLFLTTDGGRTWVPAQAENEAVARTAAFWRPDLGMIAGNNGFVSIVAGDRIVLAQTGGLRQVVRDIRLLPPAYGWLAGDRGLIRVTADAGRSWQVPAGPLPDGVESLIDFRTITAVGASVWAAGSPGSVVLTSHDIGQSWKLVPTGVSAAIRKLFFIDEKTGWAVGELGTILKTDDGGESWTPVAAGGTHAALLCFAASPDQIAWQLPARYAAEDGYLTAVAVLADRPAGTGSRTDLVLRAEAAAAETGVSAFDVVPGFAVDDDALYRSPDDVLREWDLSHDGRARQWVSADLVRAIRTWRPEVVVYRRSDPTRHDPIGHLLEQLVPDAVRQAGDPSAFAEQITLTRLRAWQPKRVFAITTIGDRGDIPLAPEEFLPHRETTLGDLAARAESLLHVPPDVAHKTVYLQRETADASFPPAASHPFAGLALAPGGGARRLWREIDPNTLAEAQRRAAARRRSDAVLTSAAAGKIEPVSLPAQLEIVVGDLPGDAAAERLLRLADLLAERNQWDAAVEVLHSAASRCRETTYYPIIVERLIQMQASGEIRAQRRLADRVVGPGGSAPAIDGPDTFLDQADRWKSQLGRESSLWGASPQIRFPLAAVARQRGYPADAEKLLLPFGYRPANDPWRACALAERWTPAEQTPPPKPLILVSRMQTKPYLDGKADEPDWGPPITLAPASGHEGPTAVLRFAYDEAFLYLYAECPKAPTVVYPPDDDRPRRRDVDASRLDRIEWMIDLDRDYCTWYLLAVDCRGYPHDALWRFTSWNPDWFIAVDRQTDRWRVEAAIPFEAITADFPQSGAAWAMGVRRIIPGWGIESFVETERATITPAMFGIFQFQ